VKTALILIDIQLDYFGGGKNPLEGSLEASKLAARLLEHFRSKQLPIIHIRHIALEPDASFFQAKTPGADFHPHVTPFSSEVIIEKHAPNSFLGTGLGDILDQIKAERLVLTGMMTHMCVDATVRAASDLGFECWLAHDACATKELVFDNHKIPARQVHSAFLAALRDGYARVMASEQILAELS
jgi:nicotinamidase-related amidase